MAEGFRVYQTRNFIKKVAKGKLSVENIKSVIRELASAATLYQDHNKLIDIREIEPLDSFVDIFKVIQESAKYHHAFRNRIAIIIANKPDRIAKIKFFKAGLALGNYQLEFFTDYEKAIDWLSDIQELH